MLCSQQQQAVVANLIIPQAAAAVKQKRGVILKNSRVRIAAMETGVKLWQVAERLGINDGNLSRKLRRELPQEEQERILKIIQELAGGGQHEE